MSYTEFCSPQLQPRPTLLFLGDCPHTAGFSPCCSGSAGVSPASKASSAKPCTGQEQTSAGGGGGGGLGGPATGGVPRKSSELLQGDTFVDLSTCPPDSLERKNLSKPRSDNCPHHLATQPGLAVLGAVPPFALTPISEGAGMG